MSSADTFLSSGAPSAHAPLPRRLIVEFRTGFGDVGLLIADGAKAIVGRRLGRAQVAIVVMGLLGIIGDAFTTLSMMATGLFEEANGVAAFGMGAIGTEVYTIGASITCLAFVAGAVGTPVEHADAGRVHARAAKIAFTLLLAGKCYMALSNAMLWAQVTGWGPFGA